MQIVPTRFRVIASPLLQSCWYGLMEKGGLCSSTYISCSLCINTIWHCKKFRYNCRAYIAP